MLELRAILHCSRFLNFQKRKMPFFQKIKIQTNNLRISIYRYNKALKVKPCECWCGRKIATLTLFVDFHAHHWKWKVFHNLFHQICNLTFCKIVKQYLLREFFEMYFVFVRFISDGMENFHCSHKIRKNKNDKQ